MFAVLSAIFVADTKNNFPSWFHTSFKVTFIAIQAYNYLFEFISWDWMETELSMIWFFFLSDYFNTYMVFK